MNSDQIVNQSATRSTMVQVLIDQNYCFMENPREKMPFCGYELGPFSSSFMRWPVLIWVKFARWDRENEFNFHRAPTLTFIELIWNCIEVYESYFSKVQNKKSDCLEQGKFFLGGKFLSLQVKVTLVTPLKFFRATDRFLQVSSTRGSKFWSSKVCEGGESREAYACRLTFGPLKFLFEINDHVTKTHFWSAFKLIENSILIQFEVMKVEFSNNYLSGDW